MVIIEHTTVIKFVPMGVYHTENHPIELNEEIKSLEERRNDYHYEKSRSNDYRHMSLKAVYEFIPKEVIV